ncbi:hypothetical protein BDZ89DRAFT_965492, partial [Hymenopellis radicata]
HPPLHVRVIPSPAMIATVAPITVPTASPRTTTELVESFMSAWSHLVGDPLLSKWIVVVLAMSISLNGYLLKAIGAGVTAGKTNLLGRMNAQSCPTSSKPVALGEN